MWIVFKIIDKSIDLWIIHKIDYYSFRIKKLLFSKRNKYVFFHISLYRLSLSIIETIEN